MIYLGSDHGGFELKEKIFKHLLLDGDGYQDCGTYNKNSCDYPDFALKVVEGVKKENYNLGILICGSGIGMSMAANRDPKIRAALCYDEITAKFSREHNNSNILCLGERIIKIEKSLRILDMWLKTPFSNEHRHNRRIQKFSSFL